MSTCKYLDILLEKFYGKTPFYNVKNLEELVGHLIIGLAPHTSVGIVGRIIGFTETHVCFGTPNWHSAKRRDADGDADAILAHRPDAMGEHNPAFIGFERGTAVADLDEFPGIFRLLA